MGGGGARWGTSKTTPGQQCPRKCLHAHMQHFFSPSALSRKNSLSQHFFIQKPNTCHETVEFTSQSRQNTKNNSWATMPLASAFTPTCNISSALAPLWRKNSLSQHFFIQKSKTCHETVEFTSQWGQNIKNYSWATMPLASAFTPTCNISSALAPLWRKNSLSQHFFIQKSKTCQNRWIYEPLGGKHQKLLRATMPHASAFTPTCNISSALALLMRKNSLSQHFFIQKPNTCHETVEFTSQSRQNTKNNSWATMPLASAFRPTCNLSSALAPLGRKNSLSQHFFIQKSKTCQKPIYEPMGAKHQKLLLGNNATRKCLHAHMQHFFSPREKKFAESAFFHTKIKNLSWNQIYEPMGAKHQLSWATMPPASAFTPTCNISSALAPLWRKNSLSQHFFIQKSKTCNETVGFTSQWGQNIKNYS